VLTGFEAQDLAAQPLAAAAVVALAAWAILVAALAVATRARPPEPRPAGLEPGGEEPPAVVALLCNGWRLGGEAVPATLVDLAARKVVRFERTGPDRFEVHLTGTAAATDALAPYERQVLDHVRGLAEGGVVPCEALTTGPQDQSRRWLARFQRAVVDDARARGASRPRWSRAMTMTVGIVAVVPAALAAGAVVALSEEGTTSGSDDPVGAFVGIGVVGWGVLMAVFRALRAERDTDEGLAAAGRWLGLAENLEAAGSFPDLPPTAVAIWDRYLAYAVAFGLAATTVHAVPLGAESDTEAWSSVGGRWRIVRVRYPARIPPGWGRPPWMVLLAGIAQTALLAFVAVQVLPAVLDGSDGVLDDVQDDQQALLLVVGAALLLVTVVLLAVTVRALTMLVLGGLDLGRARDVQGLVLRLRTRGSKSKTTSVAVDDGSTDHLRAWVPRTLPAGLRQGCWVRVKVSPNLGFVRSLEVVPEPAEALRLGTTTA
jgi:hypothetical protein